MILAQIVAALAAGVAAFAALLALGGSDDDVRFGAALCAGCATVVLVGALFLA